MWIFYGLLSHLSWAFVNTGDKFLLGQKTRYPIVYQHILGTLFGVVGIAGLIGIGMPIPPVHVLLGICCAGALWFFGSIPYMYAVQKEEITRIAIWWNMLPVFSMLLGWALFGEVLQSTERIGFVVLVMAAILASIHVSRGIVVFSKGVLYMAITCFSFALYGVILHRVLAEVPFFVVFFWASLIEGLCAQVLLFSTSVRTSIRSEALLNKTRVLLFILLLVLLEQIGLFFSFQALSFAPASLVFALEGSQVLFVFLITIVVARYDKQLLNESFEKKNLLLKIVATVLLLIGIIILTR